MSDPFIGEIRLFGFNFNPRGWVFCSGALMAISTNSTLFSLLGTTYGGDGRTTFGLPDLRGRTPLNKGRHPGSLYDWRMGQKAGQENHTLTIPEMPVHSHGATFAGTGTGSTAKLEASVGPATQATPTDGSYLAVNMDGRNLGQKIYRVNAGSGTVALGGGGASTGTVTVNNNGSSQAFSIIQPTLALNYCMASVGIYPPRS